MWGDTVLNNHRSGNHTFYSVYRWFWLLIYKRYVNLTGKRYTSKFAFLLIISRCVAFCLQKEVGGILFVCKWLYGFFCCVYVLSDHWYHCFVRRLTLSHMVTSFTTRIIINCEKWFLCCYFWVFFSLFCFSQKKKNVGFTV